MRDFHFPGREGGSAMDAAIAGSAVMAVVEPQMTGIGGDCFALVAPNGSGEVVAFNGSGRAPAAASAEDLREQGFTEVPVDSIHAVTLPGAVDGWFRLNDRFGRLDMARLLQPAIGYARNGYP
ncbi:MAG: gamma-glutamyltransferase, partial [Maritimibacter sp.]